MHATLSAAVATILTYNIKQACRTSFERRQIYSSATGAQLKSQCALLWSCTLPPAYPRLFGTMDYRLALIRPASPAPPQAHRKHRRETILAFRKVRILCCDYWQTSPSHAGAHADMLVLIFVFSLPVCVYAVLAVFCVSASISASFVPTSTDCSLPSFLPGFLSAMDYCSLPRQQELMCCVCCAGQCVIVRPLWCPPPKRRNFCLDLQCMQPTRQHLY